MLQSDSPFDAAKSTVSKWCRRINKSFFFLSNKRKIWFNDLHFLLNHSKLNYIKHSIQKMGSISIIYYYYWFTDCITKDAQPKCENALKKKQITVHDREKKQRESNVGIQNPKKKLNRKISRNLKQKNTQTLVRKKPIKSNETNQRKLFSFH